MSHDIDNPAVEDDVTDALEAAAQAEIAAEHAEACAWMTSKVTRPTDILSNFQETAAWAVAAGAWADEAEAAAKRCCAHPAEDAAASAMESYRIAQQAVRNAADIVRGDR